MLHKHILSKINRFQDEDNTKTLSQKNFLYSQRNLQECYTSLIIPPVSMVHDIFLQCLCIVYCLHVSII